jgi:hypothetical protein
MSELKGRNHRVDGLLRGSRAVSPRLEVFGQVMYLRNTFAGISHSVYPLGGLAYAVVESKPHSLNYLNEPVTGFERVDTVTAAALVATF